MTFDGGTEDSGIQLPAREAEILSLAARGLTDKQISSELGISRDTVGSYWRRILLRYNASNRTEVVARALESQLTRRVNEAERVNARLMQEIHERSEAQAKDLSSRNLLVAAQGALVAFISGQHDQDAIFQDLLGDILAATGSQSGCISEVRIDQDRNASMRYIALAGTAFEKNSKREFSDCEDTDWISSIIKSREPFVSQEGSRSPTDNFLGVPIFASTEIVGVIGMSNRPQGYDPSMVVELAPLIDSCSAMILSLRNSAR